MIPERPDTYKWRNLSYEYPEPDLKGFEAWLVGSGAKIDPPMADHEVLRFRAVNHVGIVYKNKRGVNKFVHCAGPLYHKHTRGEHLDLTPFAVAFPDRPQHNFSVLLPYTGYPRQTARWCENKRGWETLISGRLRSFLPWDVYLDWLDERNKSGR